MKKRIIIICIILVMFLIVLGGFYFYKLQTRNAIEKFIANDVMINILVAGSNKFNNNKQRFFGILSIQPGLKKIGFLFIPPNFKVNIDKRKRQLNRIDEIDINEFDNLSKSIYNDIKLKTHFYIVLYKPDIERIVDLLGGIELYVLNQAKGIHGTNYGLNYFDGIKTARYINSVEENSIFIKYDRIQDILLTIYSNKSKFKKFINIEFISEIIKTIKTNLLVQEIVTLAGFLLTDEAKIVSRILPGSFNDNGLYYLDNINMNMFEMDYLRKFIHNKEEEEAVKIKILNGTEIRGLAKRTRAFLVREGLNVVEFGTSPYPTQDTTVIISQKGEIGPASRVAKLLSLNKIYYFVDSTQLNNVLLILGRDKAI